jgi:hypothetical protein
MVSLTYLLRHRLLLRTAIATLSIRIIMLSAMSPPVQRWLSLSPVWSDNLHHYQLGLVALIVYAIYHHYYPSHPIIHNVVIPITAGLILEEHLVIIYQITHAVPYNYLTLTDTLVVVTIVALLGISDYGIRKYKT